MRVSIIRHFFSAAAFSLIACSTAVAADDARLSKVASDMSEAAADFLESLSSDQLKSASRAFDESRKDWHFVPKERDGLSLKEMNEAQRGRVFDLLGQGLREQGVELVRDVISLELVLQAIEGPNRRFSRETDLYFVWVFGDPNADIWGWRFEGHHVSINATVVKDEGVSMSPTFLGANPAEVPSGPREGFRALASEEDLAFALAESLSQEQISLAVFDTKAPRDIFTMTERKVQPLPIDGIGYDDLDEAQQERLKALVDVFLKRNRPAIYEDALDRIEADGWTRVSFAWAGPISRDAGNYYCVQGPSFLIEYDNTQNDNNHIHSVWREFEGDFGEDLLQRHHHDHDHDHDH